jgi:hypothetical protein
VRRQRSRVSQDLHLRKKGARCIIVLGSIRSPKGQFDSEGRKILEREVVQPQGEQGGLHQYGCVIFHMYMLGYAYNMLVNLE